MASNTDKFRKGARRFSTSIGLTGIGSSTTETFSLSNVTGLPTDTTIEIMVDRVDASGNLTPNKEEVIIGVLSGDTMQNCIRGVEGIAQAHSVGAVVDVRLTANQWNDVMDALLVEHNQDGSHKNIPTIEEIISATYPVGSIFITTIDTNPSLLFGIGTWVAFATGRTLVGIDPSDTDLNAAEKLYGAKQVTLTSAQSGTTAHNHTQNPHTHNLNYSAPEVGGGSTYGHVTGQNWNFSSVGTGMTSVTATNNNATAASASEAHNNMQPSIVTYMWKRTA